MRIILLISILFFSLTPLLSQKNEVDSKGRKQGDWVKYYPNGKTPEFKGKFIDDKPTGLFYYYAPDGGVSMVADHNPKTGRSAVYFYHDNKTVKCFGIFQNMKKDSVWTYFSNTGLISKRETYKNDLLDGTVYSYFVNNVKKGAPLKVVQETPYKNGKKEGVEKEYYINGVLKRESTYTNDKLNGSYKLYTLSGELESESNYFKSLRHGIATSFVEGKRVYAYFIYGKSVSFEDFKKWQDKCIATKVKTNLPAKK